MKRRWFFGVLLILMLVCGQAHAYTGEAIIRYQVLPGDTLWYLGQRFQTTAEELKILNQLKTDVIYPGQALFIPVIKTENGFQYKVLKGDSLFLIATRTNRAIQAIKSLNRLSDDLIYPGQILSIPLAREGFVPYEVQWGDSLYSISRRFNTSVEEIKLANLLSDNTILAKTILEIPAPLLVHRVEPGETLSEIAKNYSTTVHAIYETNRLHSDTLMPGQPLYIPVGSPFPVYVPGPQGEKREGYGELLSWEWARWIYNVGCVATVIDFDTGKTFEVRHLGGSNHADSEPLTPEDTAVMKSLFGGQWSWQKRAILLVVGNRTLAASMSGMPHGVESITDNEFPGHFDLYFLDSRTHNTNSLDPEHQAMVLKAAGVNK